MIFTPHKLRLVFVLGLLMQNLWATEFKNAVCSQSFQNHLSPLLKNEAALSLHDEKNLRFTFWQKTTQEIFLLKLTPNLSVLYRLTDHSLITTEFNPPQCFPLTKIQPLTPTDLEQKDRAFFNCLHQSFKQNKEALIYSWSDSMNLSKQSLQSTRDEVSQSGFHFCALKEPFSELMNHILGPKTALLHFPFYGYFSQGQFHNLVRLGLDDQARLKRQLHELQKLGKRSPQ